jgi:microsomal epoxide hydrolase
MAATKTIEVPHLGGIKAGYSLSSDSYNASKPTCVLINSMCTTVSLYRDQFSTTKLTDAMNLLAIEPLGHGATSTASEHFTYWDTAIMALQVMDALGIKKAFALGTSQGGWMVVRMALLAPERARLSPQFLREFFESSLLTLDFPRSWASCPSELRWTTNPLTLAPKVAGILPQF